MRLSNLVNIGPKLESMLNEVGIVDDDELKRIGSVEATYRLYKKNKDCASKLFALEGAIKGVRWHNIKQEEKEKLNRSFDDRCMDMSY